MTNLSESKIPSVGSFTQTAFDTHLERVKHLPDWWLNCKRAAYERFTKLPMPKRTDESWRFSNIPGLTLDGFNVSIDTAAFDKFSHTAIASASAGTFVLANNRFSMSKPLAEAAAKSGVIFDTLQNALAKHGELLKAHLFVQPPKLGSEKFAALHEAFLEDGVFVYVPKNVIVEFPGKIFHYAVGNGTALFPNTLILAEENAKITVADFFRSSGQSKKQFICGSNAIYARHGAQVTYVAMQDWNRSALSFQLNATVVCRDAKVFSLNLHVGAKQARHESFSQLQAPGAHSEMLALTIAHDMQEFDQRTQQIHQAPNTSSNLLYKNVLIDKSKTVFSGLIVVEPNAEKTDAYQSNRNLMLSDNTEANSLPGLEIKANNVRCTHGAISAHIDAEQEFYLKTRGISPTQARELLVFGFFEEVLVKVENQELHDQLAEIVRTKFI